MIKRAQQSSYLRPSSNRPIERANGMCGNVRRMDGVWTSRVAALLPSPSSLEGTGWTISGQCKELHQVLYGATRRSISL